MGYGVRGLGLGVWGHRYWDWGCGSGYDFHEERKGKDVGDTLKIEVPHIEFHTLSSYRARFCLCVCLFVCLFDVSWCVERSKTDSV
jgi:hypothetical protein